MGERAHQLAAQVAASLDQMSSLVAACSEMEWRTTCAGEGWPVAVTAHHIAASSRPLMEFVEQVANGQPLPAISLDMIHEMNAQHAQAFANCTRDETLTLLREDGASAVATIRSLSDEQLDRTAPIPLFGNNPTSTQALIEMLLIGHAQEHSESIRTALTT